MRRRAEIPPSGDRHFPFVARSVFQAHNSWPPSRPGEMRKPSIRLRSQRGQAMAEFAIVVPVLLLVLMAIMQLGIVYNNWVTLTDAARAGARKAAVCRSGCSPDAST